MAELIIREAIRRGLQEALEADDRVFLMGEDIGVYQGSYAVTRGFFEEFGPERIRDCPIAESVIIGSATGAAMAGMRPIVEMMTINFMLLGHRPGGQPRGEDELYVERPDQGAAGDPGRHGRRRTAWGDALAEL